MRKRVRIQLLLFSCLFLLLGITDTTHADNAEVLPEGVSRVVVSGKFYFPIKKRYGPDGKAEDIATDFNTELDAEVFSDISDVEAAFGMGAGTGTLGASEISFKYDVQYTNLSYQYGYSDKLTVGIIIPYWSVKSNVSAYVNPASATIGKSAIGVGFAAPLVSIAVDPFGDVEPLTTDDVQNILGAGLDVDGNGTVDIPGFGYKRIETWSGSGLGDIEIGGRYQYRDSDSWRLAFTGGLRLPTGETDDPDSLVDNPQGEGAYALLFMFNNDYTAIENWLLNVTIGYELVLPDKKTMRVPEDVNLPLTTNKEKVDRDIGDNLTLDGSASYKLSDAFSTSVHYQYMTKQKDSFSGSQGFAYGSLGEETDTTQQIVVIGATYSTLHLYKAKTFPIPLTATLAYRDRFAGTNNVLKSQYIGLSLMAFF